MEMFQREVLIAPLLESRNIENRYDARKFNWLGSLNSETGVIVVRTTTPHRTFDDLLTKEIIAGSTGPSSDFLTIAMNRVLKTKFKLVGGYRSSTEVYLAIERGEVEARVSNGWSGDKGILAPWVQGGKGAPAGGADAEEEPRPARAAADHRLRAERRPTGRCWS